MPLMEAARVKDRSERPARRRRADHLPQDPRAMWTRRSDALAALAGSGEDHLGRECGKEPCQAAQRPRPKLNRPPRRGPRGPGGPLGFTAGSTAHEPRESGKTTLRTPPPAHGRWRDEQNPTAPSHGHRPPAEPTQQTPTKTRPGRHHRTQRLSGCLAPRPDASAHGHRPSRSPTRQREIPPASPARERPPARATRPVQAD